MLAQVWRTPFASSNKVEAVVRSLRLRCALAASLILDIGGGRLSALCIERTKTTAKLDPTSKASTPTKTSHGASVAPALPTPAGSKP
jgi:hypothetical protein